METIVIAIPNPTKFVNDKRDTSPCSLGLIAIPKFVLTNSLMLGRLKTQCLEIEAGVVLLFEQMSKQLI